MLKHNCETNCHQMIIAKHYNCHNTSTDSDSAMIVQRQYHGCRSSKVQISSRFGQGHVKSGQLYQVKSGQIQVKVRSSQNKLSRSSRQGQVIKVKVKAIHENDLRHLISWPWKHSPWHWNHHPMCVSSKVMTKNAFSWNGMNEICTDC